MATGARSEESIRDEMSRLEEEIEEYRDRHHSEKSYPIKKRRIRIEQLRWVLGEETDFEEKIEQPYLHERKVEQ